MSVNGFGGRNLHNTMSVGETGGSTCDVCETRKLCGWALRFPSREKTIAELTTHLTIRVEEVAHLHQMESKHEDHVIEMGTDLQCMYDANDSLEQEVRKMKKEVKRVKRANDSLQQKVTLWCQRPEPKRKFWGQQRAREA